MNVILGVLGGALIWFGTVLGVSIIFTIPTYLLYNWLAPIYFTFLPEAWHHIPLMHVWGLTCLFYLLFTSVKAEST